MKTRILSLAVALTLVLSLLSAFPLPASATSINIGDYVRMGTYYGHPILWRCVDIDENGPLMLSDRILCLKAFDAIGSNTSGSHGRGYYYNNTQGYYRQQYGSDYWADSNIRCWLNSDASAGGVVWSCGNPPDEAHVYRGYNEYDGEAGFLSNFTQNERNAMKTVTQKSLLNGYEYSQGSSNTLNSNYHKYNYNISDVVQNYDTAYSEQVTDTMFLLDVKQINRVYQNDSQLGGNNYYIGYPTPECVSNSEYQTSSLSSTSRWYSWLRSPLAGDDGSDVRDVGSDGYVGYGAYSGDYGVRPAFYLNSQSAAFTGGDGSVSSPYSFTATFATSINIGDYVEMGTYYGEPILWRCVDIDENGPLMLSDKILCLKAFDAAGTNTSGSHGRGYYEYNTHAYYRRQYGSDYWADSNMRCWLNSTAAAGNVVWSCGNPPNAAHVWNGYNDYANEAGFLTNFKNSELAAMKTVTQKSLLNGYEYSQGSSNTLNSNYHRYSYYISDVVQNYDTAYSGQVTDTMFLLDVKQINRVYQNDSQLGGNNYYIGYPTPECVSNSEYTDSGLNSTSRWYSWLRSPGADNYGDSVRIVDSGGYVSYSSACDGDVGVRPAFYLDLSSVTFAGGNGSKGSPYSNTQKYTYKFVNENGTVIKEVTATQGTVIIPPATNPTKPSTAQYTYTFAGWNGYTQNMTLMQNVTFTATYTSTVNQYTYQFKDTDGSVLKTVTADYGATIIPPAAPADNDPYTFDHWQDFTEGMTLTENKTFTAVYKYKTYQITAEGLSSPVSVTYNDTFTLAPQTRQGSIFKGYYTQPDGQGTKITDENGESLNVYNTVGNLQVYPCFISLNTLKITGDPSGEPGEEITQRVIFSTDKQAKYLVCTLKYSKDLELSEIVGIDFNVTEDLRETAGEYTYSYLTCEYSGAGNMPTNENLVPFELTFDISDTAAVNSTLTVEIMEDAKLAGNNVYEFEGFENAQITVDPILIREITVTGASVIDSPAAFTAVITPANATNKEVEWSVDDETVAAVSQSGILTPLKKGTVTLRATAKDSSGVYGEKVITVKKYAEISSLVSNAGIWSAAFSPTVYEYEIYVPEASTSIMLTASHSGTLKSADGSKIFINNVAKAIGISETSTVLELKYTEEGFDDNTYRITIVKYKGTKTAVSADGQTFTVTPVSITNGSLVILELYNENVLVDSKFSIYTGTPIVFTTDKTYTNAKVMTWSSFTSITPLCDPELFTAPLN